MNLDSYHTSSRRKREWENSWNPWWRLPANHLHSSQPSVTASWSLLGWWGLGQGPCAPFFYHISENSWQPLCPSLGCESSEDSLGLLSYAVQWASPGPGLQRQVAQLVYRLPHCKPCPFDKQFCMAYTAIFTSYITFQSNHNGIFHSRQMWICELLICTFRQDENFNFVNW